MTNFIHNCECGAEYRIHKHKLIARDKDSLECSFCDRIIIDWNGGVMYSKELIKAPEGKE